MTYSNNLLSPGMFSEPDLNNPMGAQVLGSQLIGRGAVNALWRMGKGLVGDAWDLIQTPGKVLSGEINPYDPNQLSIPGYAARLAGYGLGAGNLLGGAGVGAARQFGAWHGTGARPFREFSDEFIGSGEGHQTFGWGHYVAGAKKTGETYRNQIAGRHEVPMSDDGFPLMDHQIAEKYYQPGSIVPGYGGTWDKVIEFRPGDEGLNNYWRVKVQQVKPNQDRINEIIDKGEEISPGGHFTPRNAMNAMVRDPAHWDAWTPVAGERERWHSTSPDPYDLALAGESRGMKMGQPGGLLHINVIPEEHELLDLDLPFRSQPQGVQDKLDGLYKKLNGVPEGQEGVSDWAFYNMQGRDIQRDIGRLVGPNGTEAGQVMAYNEINKGIEGTYPEITSRLLNNEGIPGNRFLDAASRRKPAILEHSENWQGAPGGFNADVYLRDFPVQAGHDLNGGVSSLSQGLRTQAEDASRNYAMYGYSEADRNTARQLHSLADWVDEEHRAGRISLRDDRTRNYVIFDPKNLEIKTWNGIPLTPVEGDPFAAPESNLTLQQQLNAPY